MTCSNCSIILPIKDQGLLKIRHSRVSLNPALEGLGMLSEQMKPEHWCEDNIVFRYDSRSQLEQLVNGLARLPQECLDRIQVVVTGLQHVEGFEDWLLFSQLQARLQHPDLVSIIKNQNFTSHMQPIVDYKLNIIGFEFLLRPSQHDKSFQPFRLFEVAREAGLHAHLDRSARISAIEKSATCLPTGIKRFINFLPSTIYNPAYCLNHTFETIDRLSMNTEDFVFEVVETEEIDDLNFLHQIFEQYRTRGVSVALDDVGAGYSTTELMNCLQPDYVKIDRSIIDGCHSNSDQKRQITGIVESAFRFGGQVLAEGVEQMEDFEFCRDAGVSLAQGYLFGKPEPTPPSNFILSRVV
ncbi:EAL domain-containing protein [Paenibacillus polymyxa]|uniref:EAL domain-containing protein n=1 Tax=Paenibacillus polymyxa TaxID=1406 RepID=UPI0025B656A0|nr:EAL domain-containing protein [Paenibacillus polymyxa]MDN4085303.1 EAL domain-containing protein [Paenibacillus polymyxa]MDN4111527.1 EAL domain-containing protein [Paenibacillus polymyxa]